MIKLADYQDKYRFFKLERDKEGILTITFHTNGGPIGWNLEVVEEIGRVWGDIGADRDNKVVIVTGTADTFIETLTVKSDISADIWERIASMVRRMYRNLLAIEVPMIAAVNGPARIHSEQALLCDIVIASSNTEFQDTPHYMSGLVPGDGVQLIYSQLMGYNRARYFLYMGEILSAQRALDLGLVSEVVPRDKLMGRAREIARHLLKQPDLTRRYTREITIEPIRDLYAAYLNHGLALEGMTTWNEWRLG